MSKQQKQSFLYGAIILAGAMIVVKLIGAIFKIPLGNILGGTGMGYFSTAYNLFTPIYTISIAGFPAAVARMVSASAAKKRHADIKKIYKISMTFYLVLGLIGSILMFVLSKWFVGLIGDDNALLSVVAISPAIFFGCLMAGLRGYYEGLRNMKPTAISQIVEGLVKLILGLAFSYATIQIGIKQYNQTGTVFSVAVSSSEQAHYVILPFASAAAILGITISTIAGFIYLIIRHKAKGDGISKQDVKNSEKPEKSKTLLLQLIKIAIPISVGALILNLTSVIDLVTIMDKLNFVVDNFKDRLLQDYAGLIPEIVIEQNIIANHIYGTYAGLAVSIFNLVPAFTNIFGKSALPNVSGAWASNNMNLVKKNIESVIRVTSLISIPAGVGIFVMAEPILKLLYSSKVNDALLIAPTLKLMGIAVIFLAITTPIFAILQSVGKQGLPVIFMIFGAIIKIVCNNLLIGIPDINILGAPIGTILCYSFILLASIIALIKVTKIKLNFMSLFIKPIIAAIFCGVTAWSSYGLLSRFISGNMKVLICIVLSGVVYGLVLLLIRAISKDDILMLPKSEKLVKFLEKYKILG